MQPIIDRLTQLAHEHRATLNLVRKPGHNLSGYGRTTSGHFDGRDRSIVVEYDPSIHNTADLELTTLHEIGHAATIREPVTVDAFEGLLYNLGGPTPRVIIEKEIEAWEWAVPRLSDEALGRAAARIAVSLGTYGVPEDEIATVLSLIPARPS